MGANIASGGPNPHPGPPLEGEGTSPMQSRILSCSETPGEGAGGTQNLHGNPDQYPRSTSTLPIGSSPRSMRRIFSITCDTANSAIAWAAMCGVTNTRGCCQNGCAAGSG